MSKIEIRNKMKKKKPTFVRQDAHKKKRLAQNWRKPRGIDSKLRLQLKGKGKIVKPGYKSPKEVRGMNREGLLEVLICNVQDLQKIKEGMIGIVSSTVGARKKIEILKEAKKANIKLANCDDKFIEKTEAAKKEKEEIKKKKEAKKAEKKKQAKAKEEEKKAAEEKKSESSEKKEDKEVTKDEAEKKEKDKLLTKKGAL